MASLPNPTPIHGRLQDHVAIITGAAGYIGLETVRRFLMEGSKVVMVDIDDAKLHSARESLLSTTPETHERVLTITADVTAEQDVKAFVDQTVSHFGRLDSAFLCAGFSYSSTSILETSVDLYTKVMEINCQSAFLGVKHCGLAMKKLGKPGSIVLASSASGLRATVGLTAYSMAKFALRGLCHTAAAELGQYGIRINTVHPSGVETPMFTQTWSEETRISMLAKVPLARWAQPGDISAVVAFLASNDAQYLTGGAYKIDGGSVVS